MTLGQATKIISLCLVTKAVLAAGQAYCPTAAGPCKWYDQNPGGVLCFSNEAECNSQALKCIYGANWLCIQGCESRSGQCFTLAKCILGNPDSPPCARSQAEMAGNCDGTLRPLSIPPQSYSPNNTDCYMQAKAFQLSQAGCSQQAKATIDVTSDDVIGDDDICSPDPDGSKASCLNECKNFFNYEGSGAQYCKPNPGGVCRNICLQLQTEDDCSNVCDCKVKPPPKGSCPVVHDDKNWMSCSDPEQGSADCVWCQSEHQCKPAGGKKFPMGYDESCGSPESFQPLAKPLKEAATSLVTYSAKSLCTFACSDGTSLVRCLIADTCPDSYNSCSRSDSYKLSSDACSNIAIYFYKSGGDHVEDRVAGHESVASNAMIMSTQKIIQKRAALLQAGVALDPVTPDEIAKGISDLEVKGLDKAEKSLCNFATEGSSMIFCSFIVNTPVVQWVNQEIVELPVVAQVTHQIATLAAGAISKVTEVVQDAVQAVAKAATSAVQTVVDTCKQVAGSIVHAALNFFGWIERSVFEIMTGKRGPVPRLSTAQLPLPSLTSNDVRCWKCPCGGMGCGASCVLDPQPYVVGNFCPNGEFVEDSDNPEPTTCNNYCQSPGGGINEQPAAMVI